MGYPLEVANRRRRVQAVRGRDRPGGGRKGKGRSKLQASGRGVREGRPRQVQGPSKGSVADPPAPVSYEKFRTGLTYRAVADMLWSGSPDPADWKYRRRGTVLGKWHQIKQEYYAEYLNRWDDQQVETQTKGQ